MLRFFLVVALTLSLLPAKLFASVIQVSDQEKVGRANLIVIGCVEKVWEKRELPTWVSADMPGWAEIQVEKVLKGREVKHATLRFAIGYMWDGHELQVGQNRLFLLEQVRGGYSPIGVYQGIRPVDDASHFVKLLKTFPVEVAFLKAPQPIYFDQSTMIQFKVTNRSDKPVNVLPYPMLHGFYQVAEMERYASFYMVVRSEEENGETRTLAPGASLTLTFNVRGAAPEQWKNHISTPVDVRVAVWIISDGSTERFQAFSDWMTTSVGYAPPKQ